MIFIIPAYLILKNPEVNLIPVFDGQLQIWTSNYFDRFAPNSDKCSLSFYLQTLKVKFWKKYILILQSRIHRDKLNLQ